MRRILFPGAAALALLLGACFDDGVKPPVETPGPVPEIAGRLVFPDGAAAGGAALTLRAHDSAVASPAGVSLSNGLYALQGAADRSYDLLAVLKRGDTTFAALRKNVSLILGTLEAGTDTLHPVGTLQVRVRDSANAPLAGVRCEIQGMARDTVSDLEGVCTLTGLPQGAFEVILTRSGLQPTADTLVVRPGKIVVSLPIRVVPAPNPPSPPASDLVAHWAFEDKSGNVLRDSTGGHHGVLAGNPVLAQDGVLGKSLHLDGTTYAKVPRSPEFSNLSSFTLSAWVWQDVQDMDEPVMEFSRPETLGVHVWLNTQGDKTVIPGAVYANTVPLSQSATPTMIGADMAFTGRWNHVVYTYNASTRSTRLYLNGVHTAEKTMPADQAPSTVGDFYLGYRPLDSKVARKGATLRGRLDEVKIWSRALTAVEVAQAYAALAPVVAEPVSSVLLPVADAPTVGTTTGSGLRFNTNLGLAKEMQVGVYDMSTVVKSLIRFSLPAGVEPERISRAVIRVNSYGWMNKNVHPASVTLKLHKVLRDWKEGIGNDVANSASVNGVTARERYWGAAWNTPSIGTDDVDASAAVLASVTQPRLYNGVWEFDVTALARAWAASPAQNFGVMLAPFIPAGNAQVEDYPAFYTREAVVPDSLKPRLVLDLVD